MPVYLHTDGLGSPIAETNSARIVVKRNRYEPYGAPTNNIYVDGPGFTGHVTDAATQLTYMQQRYYDPIAGRFLSLDPVAANPVSFNRYWYANNNPYKFVDPDGRYGCDGTAGDCKQIKDFVGKIGEAVHGLNSNSSDSRKLNAVMQFIGTEGDHNGVTLRPAQLPRAALGDAGPNNVIRIDIRKVSSNAATIVQRNKGISADDAKIVRGAGVVAHEGQHELDANRKDYDGPAGLPRDKANELRYERRAYGIEGALGRGLNLDIGYSTQSEVEAGAQRSLKEFCRSGGSGC